MRRTQVNDHNLLKIYDVDDSTHTFTAASLLFTFDKTTKIDFKGHPKTGSVTITPQNVINSSDLETHLNAKMTKNKPSVVDITYTDGTIESFATGDTSVLVGILYAGGENTGDGTVEYFAGVGYYSGDTGSKSYEPNKPVEVKIELITDLASAAWTVPQACVNSTIATQATITIATDTYGKWQSLVAA